MTFKEYKETCKDAGLTLVLSSQSTTTATYKDYIICRFVKMSGERFVVTPPDNQQGLAFFPVGEHNQRLCPLSGVPMKNKIFKTIQYVKEYEVEQKKKEIELDFEE